MPRLCQVIYHPMAQCLTQLGMLVTAGLGLKSNYLGAWYHTGKLLRSYELHFEDLGNLQQYI